MKQELVRINSIDKKVVLDKIGFPDNWRDIINMN